MFYGGREHDIRKRNLNNDDFRLYAKFLNEDSKAMNKKICMFVYNNCVRDARVLKEAKTLASACYDVRIVCLLDKTTHAYEELDSVRIIRLPRHPLHFKLARGIMNFIDVVILFLRTFINILLWIIYKITKTFSSSDEKSGRTKIYSHSFPILIKNVRYFVRATCYKPLSFFHKFLCFSDYYYRAFKVVMREPADIYHAHDLNTLPVAYLVKYFLGGKLVYDSHELYTEISSFSLLDRVSLRIQEKYLIRRSNQCITVNNSIAHELKRRYNIRLPSVIMNCPPSINQLSEQGNHTLRSRLGLADDIPIILYHGGYLFNRGIENLILSAHYLNKGKIVLMGWGKIEQELRSLVNAESLSDRVLFTEPVAQDKLLGVIRSATLGVIPYRFVGLNNYYTTPNKLFEYMAAGLPVAGSDFPELKRIIEGYNIGRTFNPEDRKDIADAINYMLSNRDRYKQMQGNTLEAAKTFNWENESRKLLEVYRNLEK